MSLLVVDFLDRHRAIMLQRKCDRMIGRQPFTADKFVLPLGYVAFVKARKREFAFNRLAQIDASLLWTHGVR